MHFKSLLRRFVPAVVVAFAGTLLLGGTVSASVYTSVSDTQVLVATDTTSLAQDADEPTLVLEATATTQTTITTGWDSSDSNRHYVLEDGSYATGVLEIDGIFYLFDSSGNQLTGWRTIHNSRHYYDPDTGAAYIGTQQIDGVWYLFDNTGAQKLGWRNINGLRLYYSPDTGEPQYGWICTGGYRYYATEKDGKLTGEITVNGFRYKMDGEYGNQYIGFCTFSDSTTSYYDDDGTIATEWTTISGDTYYFSSDGIMRTGWQTISGSKYYFAKNGIMQTGWHTISGNQYYFGSDGVMCTGWQYIGSYRYYFGSDGVMRTGTQTIDGKTYTFLSNGKLKVTVAKGIDISKYQGTINWNQVASSGDVDFVMIRAGYGKYTSQEDPLFESNYNACKSLGIPVGAYWYSYATTVAEAKAEAKACLEVLSGKTFEYPIAYDIEELSSLQNADAIAQAFCEVLEEAGYYVILYSYKSALETYFSSSVTSTYDVWVAHTGVSATTYSGDYTMWQYSFTGSISGISGDVDLDYCYIDYAATMQNTGKNGY